MAGNGDDLDSDSRQIESFASVERIGDAFNVFQRGAENPQAAVAYIGPRLTQAKLVDLAWAIINGPEFLTKH